MTEEDEKDLYWELDPGEDKILDEDRKLAFVS
jgi:hypothetical protein